MVEDDIVTLTSDYGYGVYGTTLFKGDFPPSPNNCVVVAGYGGRAEDVFGEAGGAIEHRRVQVRTRGAAYDQDTPAVLIERIYLDFVSLGAFVVNGTRYTALLPIQTPFPLGKDENNRWMFAVNFEAIKDRTSLSPSGQAVEREAVAVTENASAVAV